MFAQEISYAAKSTTPAAQSAVSHARASEALRARLRPRRVSNEPREERRCCARSEAPRLHARKSKKRARGQGDALLTRVWYKARSPVRRTGRGFLLHSLCFYLTAPLALSSAPSFRFSGLGIGFGSFAFCCFCMAANLLVFTNPMATPSPAACEGAL